MTNAQSVADLLNSAFEADPVAIHAMCCAFTGIPARKPMDLSMGGIAGLRYCLSDCRCL